MNQRINSTSVTDMYEINVLCIESRMLFRKNVNVIHRMENIIHRFRIVIHRFKGLLCKITGLKLKLGT